VIGWRPSVSSRHAGSHTASMGLANFTDSSTLSHLFCPLLFAPLGSSSIPTPPFPDVDAVQLRGRDSNPPTQELLNRLPPPLIPFAEGSSPGSRNHQSSLAHFFNIFLTIKIFSPLQYLFHLPSLMLRFALRRFPRSRICFSEAQRTSLHASLITPICRRACLRFASFTQYPCFFPTTAFYGGRPETTPGFFTTPRISLILSLSDCFPLPPYTSFQRCPPFFVG